MCHKLRVLKGLFSSSEFHDSHLRKCFMDQEAVVSLNDIQVGERLDYMERPVAILVRGVKVLRVKEVPLVRVQWEHQRGSEWTWEPKAECRSTIRGCSPQQTSRTKSSSSGGEL